LGISLKKNLHYFDKAKVVDELTKINRWYDAHEELRELALDYRVKSIQSAVHKFDRYYPDHQARKVFNDLLGFRSLCDNYEDVLALRPVEEFRVADLSQGKAHDDGYRGVHVYFQWDSWCYPIEIQYNTYYDRQLNNWLHKYIYKKDVDPSIGCRLRELYEGAIIRSESDLTAQLALYMDQDRSGGV
jgi:putative GTP pyrophosphokinase